jgi:FMN-dependent NADH-azoreductase
MNILAIQTGIFGDNSNSTQLVNKVVSRLAEKEQGAKTVTRDLVAEPLPYFDASVATALNTPAESRTADQQSIVELSDSLIEEIKAADAIVVGVPMYNFGVPAQMKSWIDYLARAGVTFKYTEQGPVGLLADKPLYIVAARGGVHKGQASDSQTPFLQTVFAFLGIHDIRMVYAEGLNLGEDVKNKSFEQFDTSFAEIA